MAKINSNILAIARCNTQFRAERMAQFGLKGFHISYILHICGCPGISQDKLAQRIYINKSNVARQAAFLEEEGFITRTPSASDKRVLALYPTEKATALLPAIHAIFQDWNRILTPDLPAAEIETVAPFLDKMQDKAGAWMNDH